MCLVIKEEVFKNSIGKKREVRRQNYVWHRDDINTYNNRIINNYFMDENSKNNNYMEDNKINLKVFIISSSRDGEREKKWFIKCVKVTTVK